MRHVIQVPAGAERLRLPLDCEAEYFPHFLTPRESGEILEHLEANYDLSDPMHVGTDGVARRGNGKFIFADPELTDPAHLHEVLGPRAAWPALLEGVKERLVSFFSRPFNVCLCIRYANGEASAGFHVDMPEFGSVSFLTVISLGAEREFVFRRPGDDPEEHGLVLGNGSLLTMGANCQERYQHGVPPDPGCKEPRISLSYRPYGWPRSP